MHPFLRNLIVGVVGLIIAGALAAIAVLGTDSGTSVVAILAAGILGTVVGVFLFVQGWIWSQRAWRRGFLGRSVAIAIGGGVMILVAALSLAGSVVVVVLFYLS